MAKNEPKIICRNREAERRYQLEERYEAGISLLGTEVKSLREGRANLKDSYCRFEEGELYLVGAHIAPYPQAKFCQLAKGNYPVPFGSLLLFSLPVGPDLIGCHCEISNCLTLGKVSYLWVSAQVPD